MFDVYLMVDWSARSSPAPQIPSPHAVWACWRTSDTEETFYCRTQHDAEGLLTVLLSIPIHRVLAGFDFSFAYPAWAMKKLGGWRKLWRDLAESPDDDRFLNAARLNQKLTGGSGPLWGFPENRKKPLSYDYEEFRETERRLHSRPQSSFKLMGQGSVGSQMLTGLPLLYRLRLALRGQCAVWPFEDCSKARVVFAEVWPSVIPSAKLVSPSDPILDRRQVRSLARAFLKNSLASFPEVPPIAKTEGWILSPPQYTK